MAYDYGLEFENAELNDYLLSVDDREAIDGAGFMAPLRRGSQRVASTNAQHTPPASPSPPPKRHCPVFQPMHTTPARSKPIPQCPTPETQSSPASGSRGPHPRASRAEPRLERALVPANAPCAPTANSSLPRSEPSGSVRTGEIPPYPVTISPAYNLGAAGRYGTDLSPAILDIREADVSVVEGYLAAKRLSRQAIELAVEGHLSVDLQEADAQVVSGYLAAKQLSRQAVERASLQKLNQGSAALQPMPLSQPVPIETDAPSSELLYYFDPPLPSQPPPSEPATQLELTQASSPPPPEEPPLDLFSPFGLGDGWNGDSDGGFDSEEDYLGGDDVSSTPSAPESDKGEYRFTYGKYNKRTISWVYQNDYQYIGWHKHTFGPSLFHDLAEAMASYEREHFPAPKDYVFTRGTYVGKQFPDVPDSYVRRLKNRNDNWKHPGLEAALEYWGRVAPRPPKDTSTERLKRTLKELLEEKPKTSTKRKREAEKDERRYSIRERKEMGTW